MKNLRFLFLFSIFCFLFFVLFSEADAATLFLAPSLGSYSAGATFNVSVKVNTDGKAINTAEATITFDPTKLSVASISKTGSVFSLWVSEPTFSNTDGTISFAGGKPSPGFTGSSGTLVGIIFKGLTAGTASVNFSSASVLADDGLGTNILSNLISGSYTITARQVITAPSTPSSIPVPTVGVPEAPVIISATHPDENQWYSNNDPQFSWALPSDVTAVRLLYDKNPSSIPTVTYESAISEKKLEDLSDGTHYFHARFKNSYGWGEITHRKVLIDTTPPEIFKVIVDKKGELTNPSPVLYFESTDVPSGIEYYEVVIDRGQKLTASAEDAAVSDIKKNPFQMPPLTPGVHIVEVKAFDKAKNFTLTETTVEISPIEPPEITEIPISVKIGDILEIEGKALAGVTVKIYLQKGEGEPILEEVKADSEGNFALSYDRALSKGDYLVWAQAENEKGALSNPTRKYALEVGLSPLLKIGKITVDYLNIMVTLIVLIVGTVAIMFYAWYRISIWRKRIRKESGEVRESVAKAFKALREEVEEQIEFLDGKPGLNKDERRVRDKLKEALDISEEFVGKEIKDVEKELE